jgi:hypothetical protein
MRITFGLATVLIVAALGIAAGTRRPTAYTTSV